MNIAILIFSNPSQEQYTTVDRLVEEGEKLGHTMHKLYEPKLSFTSTDSGIEILHENQPLPDLDVIIPRPNFIEEPSLRSYAIQLLVDAGYKVLNDKPSMGWAKNKLTQHVLFEKYKLPCPRWAIARKSSQASILAEQINYPVILKVAFGTHGKGIFYAENKETLDPIAEYLAIRDGNPLIVEEFIKEANRKDLRVFVLGGKVISAMQRTAPEGDIRANTSTGGTGSKVKLSKAEIELAEKTATTFELDIAGVDIIRSNRGPLVLEINSNPGFKEIERTTDSNVAKAIIKFATK
jgi:ribosomal protein S6--L-glutamate ligase